MAIFSKASGVNDTAFGKSQEPIRLVAERTEEAFEKVSAIPHIFAMDNIDTFGMKYSALTSMDDFDPVGEGGQGTEADIQVGFEKVIEPETWKKDFKLTMEMVEDGTVIRYAKTEMTKLVQAHMRTREKFGAGIILNGNSTTMTFGSRNKTATFDISTADGKAFFATDHQSITGNYTNQSNLFDLAFSYDNLCKAEEAMQDFRDDNGEILNVAPNIILIPNKEQAAARVFEAIGAEYKPGTANNDGSYQAGRWIVVKWSYLNGFSYSGQTANTFPWFLIDKPNNELYYGNVFQDRIPLTIKSYIEEKTDNNVFHARSRWTAAPNNWRFHAACIPGLGTAL